MRLTWARRHRTVMLAAVVLTGLVGSASEPSVLADELRAGTTPDGRSPGWAGHLVLVTNESPTMDPAKLAGETSMHFDRTAAIFGTLLRVRADGSLAPDLALSIESDDQRVWTIKLRPNVEFTDGTAFDADAVVYNIERQLDPANACGCAYQLATLESVRAVDRLTVELTLSEPKRDLPAAFANVNGMIGSPTAIEADLEGFGARPVGAGPFVLEEWVVDSHTTLRRNPDYWDPTKPAYETIEIRMIPDLVARAEAVRAGDADVVDAFGQVFQLVGDAGEYGYREQHSDGFFLILFNHSRGPAQDIRVREAISLAFDPDRVNEALFDGLWDPAELTCPPFQPGDPECNPGVWPGHDPERARALIADYVADGGSNEITFTGFDSAQEHAEFVQQTLSTIGLDVTLNLMNGGEGSAAIGAGNFDLAWFGFPRPPAPALARNMPSWARNLPKANIPALDEAIERAVTTLDADEAIAAWKDFQQVVAEEFVVAYYSPAFGGYLVRDAVDVGDQAIYVAIRLSELVPLS